MVLLILLTYYKLFIFLALKANYPDKFIFEPWKAPVDMQRRWGCVIGIDYPERIVIHEAASKENMAKMSVAYAANKARKSEESNGSLSVSSAREGDNTTPHANKRARK